MTKVYIEFDIDSDEDTIQPQGSRKVVKTYRERPFKSELGQKINHKQTRSVYSNDAKRKREINE